jgi:hypothetical protein
MHTGFSHVLKWLPFIPVKNAKGIRNNNGKKCYEQYNEYYCITDF